MVANRGNLQNLQKSDVVKNEGSNMSFIEENREKKGILERVLFACSDWFSDLSKSAEQNKQRTKSIEDAIRAVSVTIDKMNEDYHANKISAQKKYGGKFLKVSGIIIDIGYGRVDLGMLHDSYIQLRPHVVVRSSNVVCYFSSYYYDKLEKLKVGQELTVTGKSSESNIFIFYDCYFNWKMYLRKVL